MVAIAKREDGVPSNYRPIACLPLMWKLLTGILGDKLYGHFQGNRLFPDERQIDNAVSREARVRKRF